jgi:hypothetical protein
MDKPVTSNPLSRNTFTVVLLAPANDASAPLRAATSRATASASTLSDNCSRVSTSSTTGAERISPSTRAHCGALAVGSAGTFAPPPSRRANSSASARAGVWLRGEVSLLASARPPSSMSGTIGAMKPPGTSPGDQDGSIPLPV